MEDGDASASVLQSVVRSVAEVSQIPGYRAELADTLRSADRDDALLWTDFRRTLGALVFEFWSARQV